MFKQFHQFEGCPGSASVPTPNGVIHPDGNIHPHGNIHPGQPVHSDFGFDVWRDATGKFYLFPLTGPAIVFDTVDAAIEHARKALS